MAGRDSDDDSDTEWALLKQLEEGYGITTLEVVELVEDLISYVKKKDLLKKIQLEKTKCTRLRNAQIPKVFYEAAAGTIWTMMLAKVRQYGAKVKTEDLSNTLTLTLSETAQRRSSSVVSNRSTALITDKFGVALLTELAILNDANVALVDAVHYSVQKLEENYFEVRAQHLKYDVIDALTMMLIKDDDDLLGTVNSYIKSRRLRARRKTEAADSRYVKVSGGRTKKDKDLEDSDTSTERKRLGKEAQLKKTRDEEELAKAKKEKEEKEAQERETQLDGPLDSDDYCLDSSSDINPKDDLEDEEATTAKDLNEGRSFCKSGDGNGTLHSGRLTDAYILYFKELLSDNGGIFANAMGMGKTRAMVLAVLIGHVHFKNWTEVQNAQAEGDATEHNAVDDDDKLCPTEGERTFYCAWGRAADAWKNEVVAMDLANSTWCDLSDLLALRFCFFSDSPLENMGRLTKEEVMEMRIDTTDAISKALAAANKLVALRSYVLGGFVIVCGFGKVDKHVFRAYNTMTWALSGTPIEQGLNEILIFFNATDKRDSVTGDRIYKIEDAVYRLIAETLSYRTSAVAQRFMLKRILKTRDPWGKLISGIKGDFLDILEKEGLDELEASRRVIFNCFKMQAIASYSALATLKAAQFKIYSSCKVKRFTSNSVKDLFTNLSKDYFLVREARAITKSSLKFQNLLNLCSEVEILGTLSWIWSIAAEDAAKAANILLPLKEVCAKILIESYKPIVQAVTWLGLREKFGDESHEINLKLAKWRDLDRPWIMVASIAFAEAIILTEATHVLAEMCVSIVYFNSDSELELKVLGKQDVKTTS
ncbi:hypothetical protein HBI26_000080 [Parastagonospora nodorum]|nr:hypothetical protein HBI26_000080 [Parastagonospora nodorum]